MRKKSSTLQNITLSADRDLIESARARAKASKTTLNEEFRNWLGQFTKDRRDQDWYFQFMKQFDDISSGRKFRREEFYEE
jgi:hypothetical protein